jgi:hypothetical protein
MTEQWQPIFSAPRGLLVLVYQPKSEFLPEVYGVAKLGEFGWEPDGVSGYEWEFDMKEPTLWMHMPEIPK